MDLATLVKQINAALNVLQSDVSYSAAEIYIKQI